MNNEKHFFLEECSYLMQFNDIHNFDLNLSFVNDFEINRITVHKLYVI